MEMVTVGERDLVCLELFRPIMNRIRMFFNSKSDSFYDERELSCGEIYNFDYLVGSRFCYDEISVDSDFACSVRCSPEQFRGVGVSMLSVTELLLIFEKFLGSPCLPHWYLRRMGTCGRDIPLETQFMLIEGKIDETFVL
ncbi:hypothetical protein K1719_037314 [Acacia pycnantha]|nr:hypothetical protein K1719_037314 [Acacia pycnantha]